MIPILEEDGYEIPKWNDLSKKFNIKNDTIDKNTALNIINHVKSGSRKYKKSKPQGE